jgi:hypothetical protein
VSGTVVVELPNMATALNGAYQSGKSSVLLCSQIAFMWPMFQLPSLPLLPEASYQMMPIGP